MDSKMESINCNLCGSGDFSPVFEGRDYQHFSSLVFKLKRCNKCGMVCLNPRPEDMIRYYSERKGGIIKEHLLFLEGDKIGWMKRLRKKGRILDIGSGNGYFLSDMKKEGWEVYGNETSKSGCDFARNNLGLKNIYNADLLSLDFTERFFDVVTMRHTLEHMKKHKETLKRINIILKDDGVLIIESPDFSSLQSRFFKDKWFDLDLPRHLYQLTPSSLKKLLQSADLKIYRRDYIVNLRNSLISLKMSLLRQWGVHRTPERKGTGESETISSFHRNKVLWKLAGFTLDSICFFLSLFLVLINLDGYLRVYCKKIKTVGVGH